MFYIAHIIAILFSPVFLLLTVPLHIIVAVMKSSKKAQIAQLESINSKLEAIAAGKADKVLVPEENSSKAFLEGFKQSFKQAWIEKAWVRYMMIGLIGWIVVYNVVNL